MRAISLLSVALACSFCVLPVRAEIAEDVAQDAIEMVNGHLSNIKIISDTWMKVTAKRFRIETPIDAFKVTKVVYSNAPDMYRIAEQAAEEGDYEKALKLLIYALTKEEGKYDWFKQYLLFDIARYYVKHGGEGDFAKAREYLQRLMAEVPDSRFLPDALLLNAETFFVEGADLEAAHKAFMDARSRFKTMAAQVSIEHQKWLEGKAYYAEYRAGECLMLLKRFGEAEAVFKSVAGVDAENHPRVHYLARLGTAQAYWQEGQIEEALRDFNKLIDDAEMAGIRDIMAGAYAGLGDCYFQKGAYFEARWSYLKVAVQFFDAPDYAAKSLYRVGLCYTEIMNKEQDDAKRKNARKEATYYFKEVIADYTGFWADKAKKALETL